MEREAQTILKASGYHIPPYRLAQMSKTVAKIVELLTGNPMCGYSAKEAHYILRTANGMISDAEEDVWN